MTLPTFTLTSATTQAAAPFGIGHSFKKGDVPTGSQVVAGFSDFQVTPKNTWPDGSLKFAILAGRASLTGGTPLTVTLSLGTPATGTALTTANLKATGITASVGCGSFGTVSWATTDWDSPNATLVSGPRMSSWNYRKAVGSDPHLVAWLEVRLFAGGEVEVLPWIENGYLKVTGPTNKAATYTFSLGGAQRFSAALDVANHTRTPLISGSAITHWLGTDPVVIPAHSTVYMQATDMVPSYGTNPSTTTLNNQVQTYTPFQRGNYPVGMGVPGYHESIGLIPEWDACYVKTADPRAYRSVVFNAYSAGRYGIHYRDETTNRPLRFSSHPTLGLNPDEKGGISAIGSNTVGNVTPAGSGTLPEHYTNTHAPSMGFMAYLVTGFFYHCETSQFEATANYMKNGDTLRNNAEGVFQSSVGANVTRGAAWAIRTLFQTAAITPDADPLAADFLASSAANINWYHARYVAMSNNPQGFVEPYSDYTLSDFFTIQVNAGDPTMVFPAGHVFVNDSNHDYTNFYNGYEVAIGSQVRTVTAYNGVTRTATLSAPFTTTGLSQVELRGDNTYFEATWMQDFFTASVGYGISLGLNLTSTVLAKLAAFFAWKAQSIIGRFGTTASTEFLYRDAGIYNIAVAPSNTAKWVDGSGPWYGDWGQLYAATFAPTPDKTLGDSTLRGGNYPEASSYWGNLQPAISYAVKHQVTGAAAAYSRMTSAPNYSALLATMPDAHVWAVIPGNLSQGAQTVTHATGPVIRFGRLRNNRITISKYHGFGIPKADVASGHANPSIFESQLSGDPSNMIYGVGSFTIPATMILNENGSGSFTGDGATTVSIPITKWGNLDGTQVFEFDIGATSDTTIPVMVGSISSSLVTTSGFKLTWIAATDNVAVTGYEVSINNGSTYTNVGNVLTITETGLAAATAYPTKVRAYDSAGNRSTPLSLIVTTAASSDTTAPVQAGTISITGLTTGGFTSSWIAATDNIAVSGYEISIDSGTPSYTQIGNTLSYTKTGLTSATQFYVRVRAYDAAGNRSNAITTTAITATPGTFATSVTVTFQDRSDTPRANLTGMKWAFFDQPTPDMLGLPSAKGTGASTNSAGVSVLNITGTQLAPGATGWLVFSNSDGTATQSNLISFAGPCVTA